MVPRENKKNAYAKFGGTNKEYYGIFRTGLERHVARTERPFEIIDSDENTNVLKLR